MGGGGYVWSNSNIRDIPGVIVVEYGWLNLSKKYKSLCKIFLQQKYKINVVKFPLLGYNNSKYKERGRDRTVALKKSTYILTEYKTKVLFERI